MDLNSLIGIGGAVLGVLFLLAIFAFVFSRFYVKSSKDIALIRTGSGGEKVIKDAGGFFIPILHRITKVSLATIKIPVRRASKDALITSDRIRVDVGAEVFFRVKPNEEAISLASETLGEKVNDAAALKEFFEGKVVDSLRAVAANMSLTELHEQRPAFVQKVQDAVSKDIEKNGFELESVSLTHLDQTSINDLDENNLFDAEGLRLISVTVSEKKKERNDIERSTEVAIETKNLEAAQKNQALRRDRAFAQLDTDREIAERTNSQQQTIAIFEATTRQKTEQARISTDVLIQVAEEQSRQDLEIAVQNRNIAVYAQSQKESEAQAKANDAKAAATSSEEKVATVRETAIADRAKAIAVIKAQEDAEKVAVGRRVEAETELEVADKRAKSILVNAEATKSAAELEAQGELAKASAKAEGIRKLNEAQNTLSPAQLDAQIKTKTIETMPAIIAAAADPIKSIDSINIVDFMGNRGGSPSGINSSANGNIVDQVYDSALRYRINAPIVDQLTNSLGLGQMGNGNGLNLNSLLSTTLGSAVVADASPAVHVDEPAAHSVGEANE